jgi:hypothetical protein
MNRTKKLFLALLAFCSVSVAQQTVDVQRGSNQIDVNIGGKPFTTYYFDAKVAKPYFMPLRSAQGIIVTRGYPVANEVPAGSEHDAHIVPVFELCCISV